MSPILPPWARSHRRAAALGQPLIAQADLGGLETVTAGGNILRLISPIVAAKGARKLGGPVGTTSGPWS
jgi:hypothetical protein